MASIRQRSENGQLFFDFRWDGKRYRAPTDLVESPENRAALEPQLKRLKTALRTGTFDLRSFFPELAPHEAAPPASPAGDGQPVSSPSFVAKAVHVEVLKTPAFLNFAELWFSEFKVGWRKTYVTTVRGILDKYLIPKFGITNVGQVTRAQILEFRSELAKLSGRRSGTKLSPARINTVMLIVRQILTEAADRYEFTMPMGRLRPLKIPKSDVNPFSLDETQLLISKIRFDYQDYLKVRFFSGMRSGEIHGLKWKYVDFERRLILVREALVGGEDEYTKTDSSQRDIQMSEIVYQAMKRQHAATSKLGEYVFCNRKGEPLDTNNFTKRVWYPLLRHLGLALRRPYQTRHTAATLWLAAGEAPEWIARQLGHASTEMLFRVYSRFVPNLTRRDGSAFDRLLSNAFNGKAPHQEPEPSSTPQSLSRRSSDRPENDGGAGDGLHPPSQPPPVRRAMPVALA